MEDYLKILETSDEIKEKSKVIKKNSRRKCRPAGIMRWW
jgi:hypothetical protein